MSDSPPNSPDWIAALASSVAGLGPNQLRSLAGLLDSARISPPSSGQLQRGLSLSTALATEVARGLDRVLAIPAATVRDVQTALTMLACARSASTAPGDFVEIACTAPSRLRVPLRTTYATAVEMIKDAQLDIFIVGYVFTEGAKSLLEEVAKASRDRRVRVTVLGNRLEDNLPAFRAVWPTDCSPPRLFSSPADPEDEMSALHAKVLVCDGASALITSANFSFHGLHGNIEIGAKVTSSSVARLVDFFNSLIIGEYVHELSWR